MYHYPKQILTIPQQIQSYIDAGMEISPEDDVEIALRTIGYYRLRGYSFQLYDNSAKRYISNTTFASILRLYRFDHELSCLIFSMISQIEVALRAHLADSLLIHGDAMILCNPSIFKDKKTYWQNVSSIASEIVRANEVFIQYHFDHHEGAVPIWATVEVLSFGSLSKLIRNLKSGSKSSFEALVKDYTYTSAKGSIVLPSQKMFSSWLRAVTVLRNMCAHNARIYNRTIHTRPEIPDIDKVIPLPKHNGLYQVILAMKYLRPSDTEWMDFADKLNALLQKNYDVIQLSAMNFPEDWKEHIYC